MTVQADILVVDDELAVRRGCRSLLESAGYSVRTAREGSEALRKFAERRPDLVLLDVMMPGMNGTATCIEMRKQDPLLPILFFTAMPSDVGAVTGLGFGADDYIDKAKSPEELLARIAAALRRSEAIGAAGEALVLGAVTIDLGRQVFEGGGVSGEITRSESIMLRLLASERGRAFTHEELLAAERGEGYSGDERAVHSAVRRLKAKLGPAGELIASVYGVGYKLIR